MTELQQSIASLYEIFSRYPRPSSIECCPCGCTKPDATAKLVSLPLKELSAADLEDYAFSALTTQGSLDDFRYLLPRLLEVISKESLGYPEITFGKLAYAKWADWPSDEVDAIKSYLRSLWQAALTNFPLSESMPTFMDIESLTCSIVITGESLGSYLHSWSETTNTEADEHLIQFVTMCGSDFSGGQTLHEAYWEDSTTQADELRQWLLAPETIKRIAQATHLLRDDGYEHLFEPAFTILQNESEAVR
jgi:hypothetical protein